MRIVIIVILVLFGYCANAQLVTYKDSLAMTRWDAADFARQNGSISVVKKEIPYSLAKRVGGIYSNTLGENIPVTTYIRTKIHFNDRGRVDRWEYGFENIRFGFDRESKRPRLNTDSLSKILNRNLPSQVEKLISKRHIGKKGEVVLVIPIETTDPKQIARKDSLMKRLTESGKEEGTVKEVKRHVVRGVGNAQQVRDTMVVTELYLERELLEEVPAIIYRFPNLEILSLAHNDIEFAVIDFKRLPKLRHLQLSENMIGDKGLRLTKNNSLKLLNLQSNTLSGIPRGTRKCKNLETLWLGRNGLEGLKSAHFRKLRQVRDINFYQAGIKSLPKGIQKLKGLEVLDLYYNELTSLPKSLVKLSHLTHLAVAHNKLSALPDDIGKLNHIHTLYIHHNQLSKLPASVANLENLQILDLGFNWFNQFPEVLTKFTNLDELDISGNNLTEFPKELLGIKKLNKLHLRGNPFLKEDREVKYGEQFGLLKSKNIEVFY